MLSLHGQKKYMAEMDAARNGHALVAPTAPAEHGTIAVRVALCLGPRLAREWTLALPCDVSLEAHWPQIVTHIVACVAIEARHAGPGGQTAQLSPNEVARTLQAALQQRFAACGIWGRRCSAQTVLRSGDRLELYRPLQTTPEAARKRRFAQQGARSAGLFAARRPGAKAGY